MSIKSSQDKSIQTDELNKLKQKLNFHQDENLRLSHELSNSQKKYKVIKGQLNEIESEKSNISRKIDDLTDTLSKTKVVTKIFEDQNEFNNNKNSEERTLNISEEIEKIFSKQKL